MDIPLATLRTDNGKPVLRFERRLRHSPGKVWRAVTDPAEMASWFPATVHAEPRIGAPMRFHFGADEPVDVSGLEEGEVLEFDPPRVYAFRWSDSVLRFEIVPEGAGCRLLFSHTLGGGGTWGDLRSAPRQAAGWDGCLELLEARLDGRTGSLGDTWWFARAERYIEDFGLAEGAACDHPEGVIVRFERDLVQPPAEVWAALVEADRPVVGQRPPVRSTHGYLESGTVTAVEEASLLEYTWLADGAPAGRVRFEIDAQQPIGSRLVVGQTMPDRLREQRATALAAWQVHLELFFAALHGDVRCPWPQERTEELRRRYAERID